MAIWYTDNVTGNDATGDGTSSLPFKTINKAVSIASSSDEIRVAGGSWSAGTGTLSATSVGTTTTQTSESLVGILTPGVSLISIKDPLLGDRKLIFKVTGVTSTTITLNSPLGLVPGTNYEYEKISAWYTAGGSNTTFENLTSVGTTLTDIKVEGGWTNGFTVQDGITMFLYTAASTSVSGTGISMVPTQTGWSFNNFGFAALAFGVGYTGSGIDFGVGLGNIWMVQNRIFSNNFQNYPVNIAGMPMNFYVTYTSAQVFIGNSINTPRSFTIDNLYTLDNNSAAYGLSLSTRGKCTIDNMYVKSVATSAAGSSNGGQIYNGSWIINNLTIAWPTITDVGGYTLFGYNGIGKLINLAGLGNLTSKAFILGNTSVAQAQWVNTSINIDDYTWLGASAAGSTAGSATSFLFAKDIEGEKVLQSGAIPLYADPTVFDTGTNSLRIKRNNTPNFYVAVPIKQYFIPANATSDITFTIRAKNTGFNTTRFGLQPTPGIAGTLDTGQQAILLQTYVLTNEWADYTYTLAAANVITSADGNVILSCISEAGWTQDHVWIDSVTIS